MEHHTYSNSSDSATIPVFRPADLQKPAPEPELPAGGRTRRKRIGVLLLFAFLTALLFYGAFWTRFQKAGSPVIADYTAGGVLPGEFENQEAILVTWPDEQHPLIASKPTPPTRKKIMDALDRILAGIIKDTYRNVKTICLVSSEQSRQRAIGILQKENVSVANIEFVKVPLVDLWIRDYAPWILKSNNGSYVAIDADYYSEKRMPFSESVTPTLARLFKLKSLYAPIYFEGGNLLSNGAGLCITTDKLFFWNSRRHTKSELTKLVKDIFGANELVYLEGLKGELTGHVDMFATFTAPDTVVIGECSPDIDPLNSAVLDRNAKRLAGIKTPCGPLKVERIPIIRQDKDTWCSYTNVIFANGVLLVPTYSNADPELQEEALNVYRRLLPGWKIIDINADALAEHNGSLHCISMNLYRIGNSTPEDR